MPTRLAPNPAPPPGRQARPSPGGRAPALLSFVLVIALTVVGSGLASGTGRLRPPGTCLTPAEAELARLVNERRREHGLDPVPLSRSLSLVARWHAIDLQENDPATGKDRRGLPCGLHSWSDKGPWSPVCYTSDHFYAQKMWNKPRELTQNRYFGNGYENVYWTSGERADPGRAVDYWISRSEEGDVILERKLWDQMGWPAFGVGLYGQYAVVWFGDMPDPGGSIPPCDPRP